jgi:predicted ATPase
MASDMIQSITIEGFKSIHSIKDFPLRPINLLIGANGSGKSNFLEAFVFLNECMEGRKDDYVERNGGADKILHFGSKTTLKLNLNIFSSNCTGRGAHLEYARDDKLIGRLIGATTEGGWVGTKSPSFRRYQFHDTGFHSPLKKTNQLDDNRSLRPDGSNLASFLYLLKQRYRESFDLVRKTVQQVAPFFEDFMLEPLARNPDTIKLEWRHKRSDSEWDSWDFSDGTLRFIALATLFLQPVELRPSVILVDEPELGLHPYAIGLLASLIKQASIDTQVIAATQSPLLLDYFDPEDILVANIVDGETKIERLAPGPLAEWLKDYSLGQLWEKGELEGRPGKE